MPYLEPMGAAIAENTGRPPTRLSADAGYFSERAGTEVAPHTDLSSATEKVKHSQPVPPAPRGRTPKTLSVRERMHRKARTTAGCRVRDAHGDRRARLRTDQRGARIRALSGARTGEGPRGGGPPPRDRVRTKENRGPETAKCSSLWAHAPHHPPVTLDYDSHRCHERYYRDGLLARRTRRGDLDGRPPAGFLGRGMKDSFVQVSAVAGFQRFALDEPERPRSIGLPLGPQKHGVLHPPCVEAMRKVIQMCHKEHRDAPLQ